MVRALVYRVDLHPGCFHLYCLNTQRECSFKCMIQVFNIHAFGECLACIYVSCMQETRTFQEVYHRAGCNWPKYTIIHRYREIHCNCPIYSSNIKIKWKWKRNKTYMYMLYRGQKLLILNRRKIAAGLKYMHLCDHNNPSSISGHLWKNVTQLNIHVLKKAIKGTKVIAVKLS